MINEIVASRMHLFFLLDYNNRVLLLLNHNLGERVLRVFCCVGSIEVHVPLSNFTTKKVKASVNDKKIERRVVIIDKMIKITMLVWCVLFILTTRIQFKVFVSYLKYSILLSAFHLSITWRVESTWGNVNITKGQVLIKRTLYSILIIKEWSAQNGEVSTLLSVH